MGAHPSVFIFKRLLRAVSTISLFSLDVWFLLSSLFVWGGVSVVIRNGV